MLLAFVTGTWTTHPFRDEPYDKGVMFNVEEINTIDHGTVDDSA